MSALAAIRAQLRADQLPDASRPHLLALLASLNTTMDDAGIARGMLAGMPGPTAAVLLRQLDEGAGRLRLVRDVCEAAIKAGRAR